MPRLNKIDPASATGEAKELFDGPLKGKHLNIFKGMINSPAALRAYLDMGAALKKGSLSDAEREVVALAVSEINECDYCRAAHTAIGKAAGLSEEQTVAARRAELDDPKLNALAKLAASIVEKKGWIKEDDIARFRDAGYNDGAVVEVIATVAHTLFTNYFNHANDTEVDFPTPPKL